MFIQIDRRSATVEFTACNLLMPTGYLFRLAGKHSEGSTPSDSPVFYDRN
jgi:hypothetical protein